jgi:peptidoglycan/LPS O-acetylase OafA/YrhL
MEYRREIDGLRAVAVMPVILFHAGFQQFSGGFVGVDIFFVISGYLITSIIMAELDAGNFSIMKFYERRARRILPALFLVMAVSLPLAWFCLVPSDLKGFAQSLVAVSFFSSNVLFWQQSGYFDGAAELKPLLHTWSLAVEEQFYVLFPLFLMLFWRRDRRWLLGVLAAMTAASLALAHWGAGNAPTPTFYLLPARGWELAIGAFCAYYLAHGGRHEVPASVRQMLSLAGLAMIAASVFLYSKDTPFPSAYTLLPTLGTALVILFARPGNGAGTLLGSKLLVGIGLVSYSAYLWHQPLIAFVRHRSLEQPSMTLMAGLVVLTLVLAVLSWRFIERPFRQRGTVSRPQVFAFALSGSIVFIGIGLVGHKTDGLFAARMTKDRLDVLASATPSPKRKECHTGGDDYRKPQDACAYHSPKTEWAVFGDSHGVELAYALAEELKERGQGVRHFTYSGCGPAYHRQDKYPACSAWTDETVEYIAANPDLRNVAVTYRIHNAVLGRDGSNPQREAVWLSLKAILQRFVAAGKHVVLVMQVPELPKPVESLVLREQDPRAVPGASTNWWRQRSHFVASRLGELPPQVKVVDPQAHFCDSQRCYATRNGMSLYFDDNHVSVAGARLIAHDIVNEGPVVAARSMP